MDIGAALTALVPGQEAAATALARAAELRDVADAVRREGARLRGTTTVDWQSTAASLFRERAAALADEAGQLAGRLDDAADALTRHASLCGDRLAELEDFLRRAPERVRDLGDDLTDRLADEARPLLPGGFR